VSEEEAIAWLTGSRSMTNIIPQDPYESWLVRIAQADAAMMEQAYWILRTHKEGLLATTPTPTTKEPQ
jgi:hypothetical protein